MRKPWQVRTFLLLLALTHSAWAVLPGLVAPLQALLAVLPQILAVLLAMGASLLSFSVWRQRLQRHWKVLSLLALLILGLLWALSDQRKPQLATPSPVPVSEENWPSFRGQVTGGGGGTLTSPPIANPLKPLWSRSRSEKESYLSSPILVNDKVYAGLCEWSQLRVTGWMECLEAKTGKLLWRSPTRYPIFASPVAAQGKVYCGEGLHEHEDCQLYCWDGQSGKTLWTFPTRGHLEASPVLVNDLILFSAGGDGLYCLEAATGQLRWQATPGHCDITPAVAQDHLFAGTAYGDNALVCLELATGKTVWSQPRKLPVWGHPALDSSGRVYAGEGNGTFGKSDPRPAGGVFCVQASSGSLVWQRALPDSVNTSLALQEEHLVVGCRDGFVYCLSPQDGRLLWKHNCGAPVLASPLVHQGRVLIAGGDGRVHLLHLQDGTAISSLLVSDTACESSPMLHAGKIVLGCGNRLLCLGP